MRRREILAELARLRDELNAAAIERASLRGMANDDNRRMDFIDFRITQLKNAPRPDGVVAASLKRRALAARNALKYARPYVPSGFYAGDEAGRAIDEAITILDEVVTMPGDI